MSVKLRGKVYHYRFMLEGRRYTGSTKQTTETKAERFEAALITKLREGTLTPAMVQNKVPALGDLAPDFLTFVREAHAAGRYTDNGLKHYEDGVRLLKATRVWKLRVDRIRSEDMEVVKFKGPASANKAIRVLRRILSYAESRGLIFKVPKFKLREENERKAIVSPALEMLILKHATNPILHDAIVFALDGGMRPAEIAMMRWDNVHLDREPAYVFIAKSKTKKGRRKVGITIRMRSALEARRGNGSEWVFPSTRKNKSGKAAAGGHLLPSSLDKMWGLMKARVVAEIQEQKLDLSWPKEPSGKDMVLYSCRHTGATRYSDAVGNEFKVADFVGHVDTRTTRRYVHHDEDTGKIMDGINERKLEIVRKRA